MQPTVRLGSVRGISIGLNWSLLVIAALLVWSLAAAVLPAAAPDDTVWLHWSAAVVATAVFFASLLAHELGHSFVAQRNGVAVESVTLWMLGGIARLRGSVDDPTSELHIAVAGPAVSFGIGIVFTAVTVVAAALSAPASIVTAASWVATINIVLAVFNLLPAAPLDGGRVLQALLWRHHGDRARATRTATRAGVVTGRTMAVVGVGIALFVAIVPGIWFVLLGWFIASAATQEASSEATRDALVGVKVADAMTPDPVTVESRTTMQDFLETRVLSHRASTYPVIDDAGRAIGLVGLDELRRLDAGARAVTPVSAVMRPIAEVVTAAPGDELVGLLADLPPRPVRVVVRDPEGHPVGILAPADVAAAVQRAPFGHLQHA